MDDVAMRELAQHIKRTIDIYEASWVSNYVQVEGRRWPSGEYSKTYEQAMAEAMVPAPLRPLIYVLAGLGVCEVSDWCTSILNAYGDDVAPIANTTYAYV
jgi:hypothetical protein